MIQNAYTLICLVSIIFMDFTKRMCQICELIYMITHNRQTDSSTCVNWYMYVTFAYILSLAGVKLSSEQPILVLCFWFVTKTALITHQCAGYGWIMFAQHQSFFFFPILSVCPHPFSFHQRKAGDLTRGCRQLIPTGRRDNSYHTTSWLGIKAKEKEEEQETFVALDFPRNYSAC